jgi:hypothetical protein
VGAATWRPPSLIEIAKERPRRQHLRQIPVRGYHQPHVHADGSRAAQAVGAAQHRRPGSEVSAHRPSDRMRLVRAPRIVSSGRRFLRARDAVRVGTENALRMGDPSFLTSLRSCSTCDQDQGQQYGEKSARNAGHPRVQRTLPRAQALQVWATMFASGKNRHKRGADV